MMVCACHESASTTLDRTGDTMGCLKGKKKAKKKPGNFICKKCGAVDKKKKHICKPKKIKKK
jgi:hypothetical protein